MIGRAQISLIIFVKRAVQVLRLLIRLDTSLLHSMIVTLLKSVHDSWRISWLVQLVAERSAIAIERSRTLLGPRQHDALVGTRLLLITDQAGLTSVRILEPAELLESLISLLQLVLTLLLLADLVVLLA